jgi:hypothetical protein
MKRLVLFEVDIKAVLTWRLCPKDYIHSTCADKFFHKDDFDDNDSDNKNNNHLYEQYKSDDFISTTLQSALACDRSSIVLFD